MFFNFVCELRLLAVCVHSHVAGDFSLFSAQLCTCDISSQRCEELVRLENLVQAGGERPVMPRKSMSLNPPAVAVGAHGPRSRPVEPLNLMPELRESHTMSLGESPDPSCRVLNHSSSALVKRQFL